MLKIKLLPSTAAGKWAAVLSVVFITMITLKIKYPLPMPTILIAALGLGGFAAGIKAVMNKERAILALLSLPVGLLILYWITAEIMYPH